MYQPSHWVFNEDQAAATLRDWARDYRHSDVTEESVSARLDAVNDFLYSRQARQAGIYHNAADGEENTNERRQTA